MTIGSAAPGLRRSWTPRGALPTIFLPTFALNGRIYAFSAILPFQPICVSVSGLGGLREYCLTGSSPAAPAIFSVAFRRKVPRRGRKHVWLSNRVCPNSPATGARFLSI